MGVDSTIDSLEAFIAAGPGQALGLGIGQGIGNGSGRLWKLQGINNNTSSNNDNRNYKIKNYLI